MSNRALIQLLNAQTRYIALVVYDYVLNISDEFALMWTRRNGLAAWLYFVNRCGLVLALTVNYVPVSGYKVRACVSSRLR